MTAREAARYQDDKPKWLYIKTPQYFKNVELPIDKFLVTEAATTSTGRNKACFYASIMDKNGLSVEIEGDVGAIARIAYRKSQ
jgi:hypothetical protein